MGMVVRKITKITRVRTLVVLVKSKPPAETLGAKNKRIHHEKRIADLGKTFSTEVTAPWLINGTPWGER
jgi:hypothetical protein